ncbi:aldo/keto reductase [Fimbriimonas ginsengisoli]|uniref:Oxidoreductase, aldo/keto reductase family n=1 Tax=Fimbriimonas ginsengisoli Gsoil 348 TaxID=661478 RepID=A0A068NSB1_FIMGI|nr:aldo/keto reductase [Fimbriimonas ginsengisoli]AIE86331.1 oxidoreductase, aldo/keto reductase family [Fimbriimonas ginsengisoli Gsoil 348]
MEYRSLGRTGVQVSVACMGTMTFGWEPDDWGSHEEEAIRLTHVANDIGINFFDTADVYARGVSETILGKALKGRRDRVVLATKCHGKMDDADPNAWGNSYRHIVEACDASLRRLGTDWIDLYQIHRPQPAVPIDETLRALDDLRRAGKIRYAGCSTFAAWQVCEAHYVAKELGAAGFVTEQPPYNLLDRRVERELLPFCRTYDYGVIPWSPLAGGMLSGKYLEPGTKGARYSASDPGGRLKQVPVAKLRRLKALAERNEMSLATLSLAWVASQPGITSPIIGARSEQQLRESAAACERKLSPKLLKAVDEIFEPGSHHVNYYSANFGPNGRVR